MTDVQPCIAVAVPALLLAVGMVGHGLLCNAGGTHVRQTRRQCEQAQA
jgi:hypothetical protein